MYFGVAYYPEHWPAERWAVDAEMMQRAQINMARIGEFAWSALEPEEGRYEFGWLDQAIEILARDYENPDVIISPIGGSTFPYVGEKMARC